MGKNLIFALKKTGSLFRMFRKKIVLKLFFLYFAAISIPVALLGVVSFQMSSAAVEKDYINFKESLNLQISSSIDENLTNMTKQSASITINMDDISSFLDYTPDTIDDNYFQIQKRINNYFLSITQDNERLEGVGLIDMNGDTVFYIDKDESSFNLISVKDEPWFAETLKANGAPLLLEPHLNKFLFYNGAEATDRKKVISISRVIKDYNDNNIVKGVLILDQNIEQFAKLVASAKTIEGETLLILGKENSLVYSNDVLLDEAIEKEIVHAANEREPGTYTVSIGGKKVLLSFNASSPSGWKVISVIPLSVVSQKSSFLKKINATLLFILVIVVLIISSIVSSLINHPLKTLIASFRKLQKGDFQTTVAVKGEDEFAQIGLTFNKMVMSMRELIEQKYELNLLKQQAELESLQSQINPHFLYNTLSSVKSVIDQKDFEKASMLVQSLSDIFRYSLNRGKFVVDFSEELDHVRKYLFIQETRFSGKYDIVYDIDREVLGYPILRMTLQPLVENALTHGLEPKRGHGTLSIVAKAFSDKLHLYVVDDGTGIPSDELEKMNMLLLLDPAVQMERSPDKVGIYNVNARLRFFFGGEYGIQVTSAVGVGTKVKITLPARLDAKGAKLLENTDR